MIKTKKKIKKIKKGSGSIGNGIILCRNFQPGLCNKYPRLEKYTKQQISGMIKTFHDLFTDEVVSNRFGAELPERFGVIMVGSCPAPKKSPQFIFKKPDGSIEFRGMTNMDTDTRIAKIFFTNFEGRYSYRHKDLFKFTAASFFKSKVSVAFKKRHNLFLEVPAKINIIQLLKSFKTRERELNKIEKERPNYNEFEVG